VLERVWRKQKPSLKSKVDFIPGNKYKFGYQIYPGQIQDEIALLCPKCKGDEWIYLEKTGTGKIDKAHMKLHCSKCDYWFITSKRSLTKQLI
jgi:DNA-directed RNA polymerase subunit M/transcription elongation factor TFIIS